MCMYMCNYGNYVSQVVASHSYKGYTTICDWDQILFYEISPWSQEWCLTTKLIFQQEALKILIHVFLRL